MLYELHKIHDTNTYLCRMRLLEIETNAIGKVGLWGDLFYVQWKARWLNIPISIWLFTRKKTLFSFQQGCVPSYNINSLS